MDAEIKKFLYGSGYGSGVRIKQFKGRKVYYVDNIPCIFKSVHENYASVEVIDVNSLELKKGIYRQVRKLFCSWQDNKGSY